MLSLGQVNETRQNSIDQIISVLHQTLEDLKVPDIKCSFECDSILLGSLTKELILRGILEPRPSSPFSGYSVERLCESVRNIRSPDWRGGEHCNHDKSYHLWRLEPVTVGVEQSLTGLALSSFA